MCAQSCEMSWSRPGASAEIACACAACGDGPLTESQCQTHIAPLFSRVLRRGEIYLANHSLGRPLDQTARDIAQAIDLWYSDMDEAWGAWMAEMAAYRARVCALIGWHRPDAVVPKTSAGQGLRAVLNSIPESPVRVVTTTGEFDSIDFILRSYEQRALAHVDRCGPDAAGSFSIEPMIKALQRRTDLVVVSAVCYASGQKMRHVPELIAAAHKIGAMVLVDAYHAAGVVPMEADWRDADFVIGGNYKYTRGGPGACWLAIHPRHLDHAEPRLLTTDTGWFARCDPFGFSRDEPTARGSGGDAWLESTPSFLIPYQTRAGLDLTLGLGVDRLFAYSGELRCHLTGALLRAGVEVRTDESLFVLVPTSNPRADVAALKAAGVNVDARPHPKGDGSSSIRLYPDLLNTRAELDEAARRVAAAIKVRT